MLVVRVYGAEKTAKAFRELGLKVRDLSDAWDRIGAQVRRDAIPLTPVLSGRLVNTIRQGKTKTQAVVRAGNNTSVVYAGVQNYGGYNNIEAKHFLNRALVSNKDFAEREVRNEIQRLINRVGLD